MRRSCVLVCFLCACVGESVGQDASVDSPVGGNDATASDSGVGSDAGGGIEAGPDGGFSAFCGANPTAKFCEDFDLGVLRPNWTAQGGAVQLGSSMPHSSPNLGRANTPLVPTNGMGESTITHTVDATGATTWRLQAWVRMDSYATPDAGAPASGPRALQLMLGQTDYVNFTVRPWTGMASCFGSAKGSVVNFGSMMVGFSPNFWHSVSIEVKKTAMYSATCTIDQSTIGPVTADLNPPPNTISFAVGIWLTTIGNPVGAMQLSFDDILFLTQ